MRTFILVGVFTPRAVKPRPEGYGRWQSKGTRMLTARASQDGGQPEVVGGVVSGEVVHTVIFSLRRSFVTDR